ncbi:MAG: T9SS type A sorting domain-containing protein, partial [Bacteroidia bacterium]|nr:T9SS type A sorting domain-containing protein [Bacteroidia bacterium]
MKKLLLILLLFPSILYAQKWVDTTYQIQIDRDSVFGTAIDFAGNSRTLTMDIAYPTNDTPPMCGRPLVIVLFGGAWLSGDKSVGEVQRLMEDFAKRGYVAVAPNYRLGMFQTNSNWNCNISPIFDIEWNCLNAQDTSEWYRAYYRAVQDTKGAIRYMVNQRENFNINVQNIFTTGFSAGGFTALGSAFLDHESEWKSFADALPDALAPNVIYENGCIKKYGWDSSIASMNLERASLGNLDGDLNQPATSPFRIRGVGNLFGGMFFNLLDSNDGNHSAAIYGFHQPNDLIVPYNINRKVFDGFSSCLYSLCNQGIINRPYAYSSPTIRDWATQTSGFTKVDFLFDSTKNYTDCAGQIANPSQGGHQLDNWNRTWNMATYFASKIDTTDCVIVDQVKQINEVIGVLYPNPAASRITVETNAQIQSISIYNTLGKLHSTYAVGNLKSYTITNLKLENSVYLCSIHTDKGVII